jgi:hypothetical protein
VSLFSVLSWTVALVVGWVAVDGLLRHFSVEPWIFLVLWSSAGLAVAGSAFRGLRGQQCRRP